MYIINNTRQKKSDKNNYHFMASINYMYKAAVYFWVCKITQDRLKLNHMYHPLLLSLCAEY